MNSLRKLKTKLKKKEYTIGETKFVLDSNYVIKEQRAYGTVISAQDLNEDDPLEAQVAIKKIDKIFEHRVLSKRLLRELIILRLLQNDNIISIKKILLPDKEQFNDIYIVYELMEYDLATVLSSDQPFTKELVKLFFFQILKGIKYLHDCNIIHRDLKPRNILANSDCQLKLCDFGLSRPLFNNMKEKKNLLTEYVTTRWYRSPEVLLSWNRYNKSVDVWSAGCIFAELITRKPLFPGENSKILRLRLVHHQLDLIFDLIGTPNFEEIEKIGQTETTKSYLLNIVKKPRKNFEEVFNFDKDALDLLSKMLEFDPDKRISIEEALKHPYLKEFKDIADADDEFKPIKLSKFDFLYEEKDLSKEEIKGKKIFNKLDLILNEILLYYDDDLAKEYMEKKRKFDKENQI